MVSTACWQVWKMHGRSTCHAAQEPNGSSMAWCHDWNWHRRKCGASRRNNALAAGQRRHHLCMVPDDGRRSRQHRRAFEGGRDCPLARLDDAAVAHPAREAARRIVRVTAVRRRGRSPTTRRSSVAGSRIARSRAQRCANRWCCSRPATLCCRWSRLRKSWVAGAAPTTSATLRRLDRQAGRQRQHQRRFFRAHVYLLPASASVGPAAARQR